MEKTEEATPRRKRRALAEGDVPLSLVATRWSAFGVACLLGPAALGAMTARFEEHLRGALLAPAPLSVGALADATLGLPGEIAALSLPLVATMAAAALATGVVQTGGVFALGRQRPENGRSGTTALVGGFVVTALLVGAVHTLLTAAPDLADALGSPRHELLVLGAVLGRFAGVALATLAVAAAVDLLVVRLAWLGRLRMTWRERQDERRESEGDPEMKRRSRHLRRLFTPPLPTPTPPPRRDDPP